MGRIRIKEVGLYCLFHNLPALAIIPAFIPNPQQLLNIQNFPYFSGES